MLSLKNAGSIAFRRYIINKKIYVFGAGRALESCLAIYLEEHEIEMIVDNKQDLWGKTIPHRGKNIRISSLNDFVMRIHSEKSNCIIFITSPIYATEIVEQLDEIPELDGVECFLQVLIRNTKEQVKPFEFHIGPQRIPKLIHYIWVGKQPLSDEYKTNIDTWRKYNPDYEIIEWNEDNYNFKKNDYVKEAYESECWGFVPNYARLDIIFQHGGIYLDTDVEVIKNFDVLLNDDAFLCMGSADRINQGCGFGAVAGNRLIERMKREFEESHFLNDEGMPGMRPCNSFINPIMKEFGFKLDNQYQRVNGVALYPTEVMSPSTIPGMEDWKSDKTVSIHHEVGSWRKDKEKNRMNMLNRIIKERVQNI